MKNIDLLPIPSEAKERLNEFAKQYKMFAHIIVEVVTFKDNRLVVRTEQKDLDAGKQLSSKELHKRVKDMFAGEIPEEWTLLISAVDFDRRDIEGVDKEYIRKRMNELRLKARNIETYTGIDKATLSVILSGEKKLTKWQKVAFYYFFKYREVSEFSNRKE